MNFVNSIVYNGNQNVHVWALLYCTVGARVLTLWTPDQYTNRSRVVTSRVTWEFLSFKLLFTTKHVFFLFFFFINGYLNLQMQNKRN